MTLYLIPDYSIYYGGEWRKAGERVKISPADVPELRVHGKIEETEEIKTAADEVKAETKTARKRRN